MQHGGLKFRDRKLNTIPFYKIEFSPFNRIGASNNDVMALLIRKEPLMIYLPCWGYKRFVTSFVDNPESYVLKLLNLSCN